jgi:hypothetical protein
VGGRLRMASNGGRGMRRRSPASSCASWWSGQPADVGGQLMVGEFSLVFYFSVDCSSS